MKFDISDIVSISKPSESELKLHLNICICTIVIQKKKDILNSRMILVILEIVHSNAIEGEKMSNGINYT